VRKYGPPAGGSGVQKPGGLSRGIVIAGRSIFQSQGQLFTDLRNMAINVNKEPLYVIVYGSGSEVMHASNYGQHVSIQSDESLFIQFGTRKSSPLQ
jgi:hypothetical protein